MANFLKSWKKNTSLDVLLCIIPLVLKNGKSFETEKTIQSIKSIEPDISNKDLFDCMILFSYIFDFFYGTTLEDTIDNINSLNQECINKINVSAVPLLEKNNLISEKSEYNSIIALKDYIESNKTDFENYNYSTETTKAISYFLRGIGKEKKIKNAEIENKYGDSIKKILLSI